MQHLEPLSIVVLGVDSGGVSGGGVCHHWVHSDGGRHIEVVVNAFGCIVSLSWCWDGGGCSWSTWFLFHTPGRWTVIVIVGSGVIVSSSLFVVVVVAVGGCSHCCW